MKTFKRAENYRQAQLRTQLVFLRNSGAFTDVARAGNGRFLGIAREFVLPIECKQENLFETRRIDVREYFKRHHITWHSARSHLLSSQICCLNFLAPFSSDPRALKALLQNVVGPIDEMLETEAGRFVSFEFTGDRDYLNEWKNGVHTRGSNCTSVDAMVRFRTPDGRDEAALIEWKYTERDGDQEAMIRNAQSGFAATRKSHSFRKVRFERTSASTSVICLQSRYFSCTGSKCSLLSCSETRN